MKSNSDSPTKNPCKEDITCIFTDVPNFLSEENSQENTSWTQGSHQDILVGRKTSPGFSNEISRKEKRMTVGNLQRAETSSKSQCTLNSDGSTPEATKPKNFKSTFCDSIEIMLPFNTHLFKKKSNDIDVERSYDLEELCQDCFWIVKLIKEQSSESSFSDDEEYMSKLREYQLKNKKASEEKLGADSDDTVDFDIFDKNRVKELLKEARVSILESCIILAAGKLYNKVQKKSKSSASICDVPSEVILDEIMADDELSEKKSKLCLALGQMVTKYLNIK